MSDLYRRAPHKTVDGVPHFAESDDYVENYDQISDDHLASVDRGQGNPFMEEALWSDIERNTIELIQSRVAEGSSILDIGVGTGRLLAHFPGLRRYGIDVSLGYLARLGDSGIEVCMGKVEDLPYENDAFDTVVCTDVLEHVLDLYAAVREIRRVLRPGGLAIIRVPYRENLAPYLNPSYPYRLAHVRNFDEHSLALLFCRVLDFDREDQHFDKSLATGQFKIYLPRGRGMITYFFAHIAKLLPSLRNSFFIFYRPITITMALRKNAEHRIAENSSGERAVTAAANVSVTERNVLILCNAESSHIGTVRDHLAAFGQYSGNRICIADAPSAAKFDIDFGMFDVVVLHYSLIISSARHVPPAVARKIRTFGGYKILFVQDEYRWVDRTVAAIADLGVDLIYSVINEDALDKIYHHPSIGQVRRKVTLTGFVPEELTALKVPDFAERSIDVGYRARRVPAWLGQFAQEKFSIGQRFKKEAERRGLRCDIEHTENRRIYGKRWISFVSNCKAMLGTESGASYIDFAGTAQPTVDEFERDNPRVIFDEIRERFLKDSDGDIVIHVISPRCFEAAALRTLMILYPGDYSGVLEPWRHYVPLARDHGNMDEVVAVLRDPVRARKIIDNAYREVALNPRFGFQAMVEEFDRDVAAHAPRRPDAARRGDSRTRLPRDRSAAALGELEQRIDRYYRCTRRIFLKLRLTVYTSVHWVVMKLIPRERQLAVIAAIKSAGRRIGLP